jgi:hypothetical protein
MPTAEQLGLYQSLLNNREALQQLDAATTLADFTELMQQFLQWPGLSEPQLLEFLAKQNQQPQLVDLNAFSVCWQPYSYQPKQQTLCWMPAFKPLSLPFYADEIAAVRCSLLATLIQPKTTLLPLLSQRLLLPEAKPLLLIFHWSRCGSTLLSGSFARLSSCLVLSESNVLSDILLDDNLAGQHAELFDLALRLQGRFRFAQQHLIVKLNAWDLAHWPLLSALYPNVRFCCVSREPLAILTSHQREAGRHMVAQQAALLPDLELAADANIRFLLRFQLAVLTRLADLSRQLWLSGRCSMLSYAWLCQASPQQLATLAGLTLSSQQQQAIQPFRLSDAKQHGQPYQGVKTSAEQVFSATELIWLRNQLTDLTLWLQQFESVQAAVVDSELSL